MQLPINKLLEDMMGYAYTCLRYYPKSERFIIGADIRNVMLSLQGVVVGCGKKYYKKTALQNADIELAKLKVLVRLSQSLGLLSFKRYERWARYLGDIGNMLGGWIRSVNPKAESA